MQGKFAYLLFYGDFKKMTKKSHRNTIRSSNSLDPDKAGLFVGPYLGPSCLQRLSADDKRDIYLVKVIII